jgi:hypothetical protein
MRPDSQASISGFMVSASRAESHRRSQRYVTRVRPQKDGSLILTLDDQRSSNIRRDVGEPGYWTMTDGGRCACACAQGGFLIINDFGAGQLKRRCAA